MTENTTILIKKTTALRLKKAQKQIGETYDDTINDLLDFKEDVKND